MAFWSLSRTAAASAAKVLSPTMLTVTDSLVGQGRCRLSPRLAARTCPGVRRLSLFASSDQGQQTSDDSNIQVQRESRSPATRRTNGLRRGRGNPFLDMWDPMLGTRSLRQMMNTIDRLFEDPLIGFPPSTIAQDFRAPWDVKEDENAFKLRFDMPGLGKDEVKVMVEDGDLVIKGEHKAEEQKDSDKENGSSSFRSYGSYYTRMKLPENAKPEEVKAELKNGVLQVVVPKSNEGPKKNVIDINVE